MMLQDPAAPSSADDVFQNVLLALFQLHGQVLNAADVMSGDFGLTGARWQVMRVVVRRPLTVSQIARRLELQRQSVQRTVDHLRTEGIVAIEPNVDHARAGLVALTDTGREALAALQERQRAWVQRCLRGLSRAKLDELEAGLADLVRRVGRATEREQALSGQPAAGHAGSAPLGRRLVAA